MDPVHLTNLVVILCTLAAALGVIAGVIYTWACCRTRPLKVPLVALATLLWIFAALLLWRLYVVSCDETFNVPAVGFLMLMVIAGYTFFIYGTFKDHIVLHGLPPPPE